MKKALITGITGQDGSYLARLLLQKGYQVHGVRRRSSSFNTFRIDDLITDKNVYQKKLFLHFGDMTDTSSLSRIVSEVLPDEIYNLAAQSHVHVSFETPEYTANADALGTLRLLEVIRLNSNLRNCRFYQASSSEIFGISDAPQSEKSIFQPQSPYATSKLFAYWITRNYREAYNLFACNGILFNHESPFRGETFVTRKVIRALVSYSLGKQVTLKLGNLNAVRDWGHAREYVEAMWMMLNHHEPLDLVIATGNSYSVREFILMVARKLSLDLEWEGHNQDEKAVNRINGDIVVEIDPIYFRPNEVPNLVGEASLASKVLGWKPKVTLEMLISEMVNYELTFQSKVFGL